MIEKWQAKYECYSINKFMNICMVSDLFDSPYGGGPIVIKRFVEKLREREYNITIITSKYKNKGAVERKENLVIYRFPSITLPKTQGEYTFSFPSHKRIREIYKKERIDVIHCHVPSLLALACVLEARKIDIPSVATNHLLSETFFFNLFLNNRELNGLFYKSLNFFYNRVDTVICPSLYGARTLKNHGLNTRTIVLSNGIDLSNFNPSLDSKQFLKEFRLDENTKKILYVGRLMKEKGLDVLLKAYSLVDSRIPDTKLIIVGKGYLQKDLEKLAEKLGLGSVIFTGFISDTLLKQAYASSDIFVLPSYAEIQPLVLLEALAMGLPAIGTSIGGIPEMIINEWNGYIVNPGDCGGLAEKITKVLTDEELKERFSENSLKMAKNHDIERSSDKLERLYNNLVSRD